MIAIVDYGAGNLCSVRKAFEYLSQPAEITSSPDVIDRASSIVLPGVGHFQGTEALSSNGSGAAIRSALSRGVPFLGICVGMQWLFEGSEEAPGTPGLGAFQGLCSRFPEGVKSPHVGWNRLEVCSDSRLLHGLASGAFLYFTHSYRAPMVTATAARTRHGDLFSAVVEQENVFGVQFHPEKSAEAGLQILKRFCSL